VPVATESLADPKIAVVVRDDLAGWQKLNVTAFLVSGIGARHPELIGQPYQDASEVVYLPMFGHPVLVFAAEARGIRRAFDRALSRGLTMSVYTDKLFVTDNDVDNRAMVAAQRTEDLDLAPPSRNCGRRGRIPAVSAAIS
jgi:hypothetical protein